MITSVLFDGELGAGKTLSAVFLAYYWSKQGGVPLLSNMTIEGAEKIACAEDWSKIIQYKEKGSIVVLDEAQSVVDSRTSMTKGQVKFTEFLMYLRKLRCVVIFTTPSMNMVDLRVRQRLSAWVHVAKRNDKILWDIYDPYTNQFKNSRIIKQSSMSLCYPLYDTYEIVAPVALPDDLSHFLGG